jgi:hypothetical protein
MRLRLRTGSVSHEPENFRILPTRSSSIEMIHDKPTTSPDVFSRILDGSDLQIPHVCLSSLLHIVQPNFLDSTNFREEIQKRPRFKLFKVCCGRASQ